MTPPGDEERDDLLYEAWSLIANAYHGDWEEDPTWRDAAVLWRERWHAHLEEQKEYSQR